MSSVPSSTTIPSAIARGGDTSVGDVVPADTASTSLAFAHTWLKLTSTLDATVGAALESNALPGATPSLDRALPSSFHY